MPQIVKDSLLCGEIQIVHTCRATCSGLVSNHALHHSSMAILPHQKGLLQIDGALKNLGCIGQFGCVSVAAHEEDGETTLCTTLLPFARRGLCNGFLGGVVSTGAIVGGGFLGSAGVRRGAVARGASTTLLRSRLRLIQLLLLSREWLALQVFQSTVEISLEKLFSGLLIILLNTQNVVQSLLTYSLVLDLKLLHKVDIAIVQGLHPLIEHILEGF
mmetsp:Transcript_6062/g.22922  ORF Transcript_6062/g.22922 Transcript_6062/m.22922 type:complete len:216 (-) Transcript_6062:610-1257(-)